MNAKGSQGQSGPISGVAGRPQGQTDIWQMMEGDKIA